MAKKPITARITDRDGVEYVTRRENVNAAFVSWNWNRTARVAGWTTKGRAGVAKAIESLVHPDDVEIFDLPTDD